MTERWQDVEPILDAALARAPHERPAFIAEACSGDQALRREVESLLAQEAAANGLLSTPAFVLETESLEPPVIVGRAIGPYTVEALIGAGGMGEVYRAHDAQLDRDVAIKILPAAFTNDSDRLARARGAVPRNGGVVSANAHHAARTGNFDALLSGKRVPVEGGSREGAGDAGIQRLGLPGRRRLRLCIRACVNATKHLPNRSSMRAIDYVMTTSRSCLRSGDTPWPIPPRPSTRST